MMRMRGEAWLEGMEIRGRSGLHLSIPELGGRLSVSSWEQLDHTVSEVALPGSSSYRPDPNELMALLQVYPWHVDTLLQMSEVYRLQSGM
jgi:hypothetical protein